MRRRFGIPSRAELAGAMRPGGLRIYAFGFVVLLASEVVAGIGTALSGPVWLLVVLAGVAVGAFCTMFATGYRRATSAEAERLRSGSVWHVTDRRAAAGDVVVLDPAFGRWSTRLLRWDRPSLPRRCCYVFASEPTPAQVRANVGRRRRGGVLELAGSGISGRVFVRGSAVAIPERSELTVVGWTALPDETPAAAS